MALIWALGISVQVILIIRGIEQLVVGDAAGWILIAIGGVMLLLLLAVMVWQLVSRKPQ